MPKKLCIAPVPRDLVDARGELSPESSCWDSEFWALITFHMPSDTIRGASRKKKPVCPLSHCPGGSGHTQWWILRLRHCPVSRCWAHVPLFVTNQHNSSAAVEPGYSFSDRESLRTRSLAARPLFDWLLDSN